MSSKQDLTRQFTAEEGIIHIGGIEALVRQMLGGESAPEPAETLTA